MLHEQGELLLLELLVLLAKEWNTRTEVDSLGQIPLPYPYNSSPSMGSPPAMRDTTKSSQAAKR